MAKNEITKILTAKDKEVTKTPGANGALSRMFRQMLWDLEINLPRFHNYMMDFISDTRNGVPDNKKDHSSVRGNLTKEFAKPQMTWKIFCKAMRFIQLVKIDFVIKAYHVNGKTSLHQVTVNYGARKDLQNFTEELEQPEDQEDVEYHAALDQNQIKED